MLFYESTGRVGRSATESMLREIGGIEREWWRASLALEAREAGRPSVLAGQTRLFHRTGIPDDVDLLMAFGDALFILDRLTAWAARFKIKWHLRMNDEDWGAIDPGGWTKPLQDQMRKWAARVGLPRTDRDRWSVPEDQRAELLRLYAGRNSGHKEG